MNANASGERAVLVIKGVAGLQELAGQDLGVSEWTPVEQDKVTAFARLTGDEQWIHVDPERAKSGPFGAEGRVPGPDARHAGRGDGAGRRAQVVYHPNYEAEGQPKPCCVADLVFRYTQDRDL